ncbi:MAG: AraC family transcriptional regulator [Deltaproteobacteria bacterium]|nr:AraC family transcriptional regulator [Deltaproteobacteria bacterium]
MTWPFTRIVKDYRVELDVLRQTGLEDNILASSNARIPHEIAWKLMELSLKKTGNPAIGLQAGRVIEAADWGVLGLAAVNCADLRRALQYCSDHMRLLDDLVEVVLIERSDRAIWEFQYGVVRALPAVNDYIVSSAATGVARFLGRREPLLGVSIVHTAPAYAGEYQRFFRAPVRFNAEHNALILPLTLLDRPVPRANPDMFVAFDKEVKKQLKELMRSSSATVEVQRLVTKQLVNGTVSMKLTAKQVHMSPATLKRRLNEEGTTHSKIVDEVRKEFALRYLANQRLPIAEVALRLGFSSASAFGKAFKRWQGITPIAYRKRKGS